MEVLESCVGLRRLHLDFAEDLREVVLGLPSLSGEHTRETARPPNSLTLLLAELKDLSIFTEGRGVATLSFLKHDPPFTLNHSSFRSGPHPSSPPSTWTFSSSRAGNTFRAWFSTLGPMRAGRRCGSTGSSWVISSVSRDSLQLSASKSPTNFNSPQPTPSSERPPRLHTWSSSMPTTSTTHPCSTSSPLPSSPSTSRSFSTPTGHRKSLSPLRTMSSETSFLPCHPSHRWT